MLGAAACAAEPPRGTAVFAEQPPAVDGRLDEAIWRQAEPLMIGETGNGEARFVWTAEGVYVGFRAKDATPVYGSFPPGQPIYLEDVFEVFIDQAGDHRQYFEIQADPAGQFFIKCYVLTAKPRLTEERRLAQEFVESDLWRYDYPAPDGFKVASAMDAKSGDWTLEMFLPAHFINRRRGGAPMTPGTWRLNLVRHDWEQPRDAEGRKGKFLYWAPVLEGHPHLSPEAMGWLEFKAR